MILQETVFSADAPDRECDITSCQPARPVQAHLSEPGLKRVWQADEAAALQEISGAVNVLMRLS